MSRLTSKVSSHVIQAEDNAMLRDKGVYRAEYEFEEIRRKIVRERED